MKNKFRRVLESPSALAMFVIMFLSLMFFFRDCLFPNLTRTEMFEALQFFEIIVGIAMTVAIFILTHKIAIGQEKTQRDNIKTQLFKDRYKIFEAINDFRNAIICIGKFRNDNNGDYDLVAYKKKLRQAYDNVVENKSLAVCLFNNILSKYETIESEGLLLISILSAVDVNNKKRVQEFFTQDRKRFEDKFKETQLFEIIFNDINISNLDK